MCIRDRFTLDWVHPRTLHPEKNIERVDVHVPLPDIIPVDLKLEKFRAYLPTSTKVREESSINSTCLHLKRWFGFLDAGCDLRVVS